MMAGDGENRRNLSGMFMFDQINGQLIDNRRDMESILIRRKHYGMNYV